MSHQFNKKHTSCKECIFAEYNGITQTGCTSGKLDYFRTKKPNIEIIDAYDEEKEFCVIDGALCFHKRTSKWANSIDSNQWLEAVEKELSPQYQIIIFANNSIEDVETTISSVAKSSVLPQHVTVIRTWNNAIEPTLINALLQKYKIPKWRCENLTYEMSKPYAIHLVLSLLLKTYVVVMEAGQELPYLLLKYMLDSILYDNLVFAIINYGDIKIYSGYIYKAMQGNSFGEFENKVKEQCPSLITNL